MSITLGTSVITSYITGIKITPYVNGVVGSDSFYAQEVVLGAALAQADDTRTPVESETKDAAIFVAVTKGEKTFTLNVADLQPVLMQQYFGCTIVGNNVYHPASASTVYAQLELEFKQGYSKIVFPKVQMNSKIVGETLKQGVLQAQIVCTALVGTYNGYSTDMVEVVRGATNGAVTLKTVLLANPIGGGITVVCNLVDVPSGTVITGGTNTVNIIHGATADITYLSGGTPVAPASPITVTGGYTVNVTGLTTGTYYFRAAAKCTPSGGGQLMVYGEAISAVITGA